MKIRRDDGSATPGTMAGDGTVRVLAPAKINLHLEVLGKRPDGYHDIETLILAVDLYDEIIIDSNRSGSLELTCNEAELSAGSDNLVMKAARLLKERTGCERGAAIRLEKRIPWAAGLGGGSSDAAAALAGLNEAWKLGLSTDQLSSMGAEIGSDVPFFFHAPAAFCTGRGEIAKPVPVGRAFDIVLVKPPVGLSTAEVYAECGKQPWEGRKVDPQTALDALASGDIETLGRALHNRLQESAVRIYPPVAELYRRMQATGVAGCLLSGSGSCLFALCRNGREAEQVIDVLRREWPMEAGLANPRTFLVRSCV